MSCSIPPVLDGVVRIDAHLLGDPRGAEDPVEGLGKSLDIPGWKDVAVDSILDEIKGAARVVGDDYRTRRIHHLIDDQSPRLVPRGKDKDSGEIEKAGKLRLIAKSCETDGIKSSGCRLALKRAPLLAVADDNQVGCRPYVRLNQTRIGLHEVGTVLTLLQLGREKYDLPRGIKIQLGLQPGAQGLRLYGKPAEVAVVHGVRHKKLGYTPAEVMTPVFRRGGADRQHCVRKRFECGKEEPLGSKFRFAAAAVP